MTFQEFYELYGEWSEKPVHLSSFRRSYFNGGWRDYLRIASTVQHGKCSTCERLKDLKKKASTHAQISQVQQAHSKHVQAVLADRNCDSRAEQLGVDSVTPLAKGVEWQAKIPREKGCLNWTQDHMDQSKFRVPRNTSMSKTLVDSWRPQVGAAGIILDGLGKFLFLKDQDLGKDANIQCSVTGRALQVWCFAKWCGKHFCSFSIFFTVIFRRFGIFPLIQRRWCLRHWVRGRCPCLCIGAASPTMHRLNRKTTPSWSS